MDLQAELDAMRKSTRRTWGWVLALSLLAAVLAGLGIYNSAAAGQGIGIGEAVFVTGLVLGLVQAANAVRHLGRR